MSQEPNPLERILDSAARRMSGGLHPVELLERIREAYLQGAVGGAAPNRITVALAPGDFRSLRASLPGLREEALAALHAIEAERNLTRVAPLDVRFESSPSATEGRPAITAGFASTNPAPTAAPPAGATRRIMRHRGIALVVDGSLRVPVTHTPFAIGRGSGNDLVLASLSASRRHAELLWTDEGFVLRDLGSRNGLVVDGERYEAVIMAPGRRVVVGDLTLTLERTA